MLRQEGRTDGQGASAGGGPEECGGDEPGDEDEAGKTDLDDVPGARDFVEVPGGGDEPGGPDPAGAEGVDCGTWDVRVLGGAAVHLVQTVEVDVITVVEMVAVV